MIDEITIEELHKKLEELRRLNRVSYNKMSNVIGYSGEGLNKALRNNTLSIAQINKIGKEFDFEEELNKLLPTFDNSPIKNETAQYKVKGGELDNLAVMVNENWEGLLKHPLLVPKFESEIYKKAFDLVMEKMKG